jgi:metal-responsive CopG/Arc/MetJ family transcriptional regulator
MQPPNIVLPKWYSSSMKTKTSLTLSEDLVASLDRIAGPTVSRSAFIERILRSFVEQRAQERRNAREAAAINRHAGKLNVEMHDALGFQASSLER